MEFINCLWKQKQFEIGNSSEKHTVEKKLLLETMPGWTQKHEGQSLNGPILKCFVLRLISRHKPNIQTTEHTGHMVDLTKLWATFSSLVLKPFATTMQT